MSTADRERIDRRLGQIGRFLAQAGDQLPPVVVDPHGTVAVETVANIRHACASLYVVVQLQETRLRAIEDAATDTGGGARGGAGGARA